MIYPDDGRTLVKCKCDCGNECVVSAASWQSGNTKSCGCAKVESSTIGNRTDERGKRFGNLVVLDIDWDAHPTTATCQCDCGNIITVRKSHLKTGHTTSCGCTRHQARVDYTGMIAESGVEFLRISHYDTTRNKWMWVCRCPYCGNEFIALPTYILSLDTTSCGCKKQSLGELKIEQWLQENQISYRKQVRFEECRDHHTLPFDFAIYNHNDELVALIEYDGRQHFEVIETWGGEDGLRIRQHHDSIKTNFCNKHHIPLLRFTYLESFTEIGSTLNDFCKSVETVIPPLATTEVSLFS